MKAVIVISDRDNVATALEPLEIGQHVKIGDREVDVLERIPSGHKVAITGIAAGAPVIKYGSTIGHATSAIRPGTHVHTHNLESDRGRGDLAAAPHRS
jgi:altronate dehydratase small subunit